MNAVLSSAAILLTAIALLRVGAAVMQPIRHYFPEPYPPLPGSAGPVRRR
jgi:hypothetical protein